MEQNKMTPTPWKFVEQNGYLNIWHDRIIDLEYIIVDHDINEDHSVGIRVDQSKERANFNAIVSAVNATYGNGINPEAVPDVVRTLKNLCDYFDWLIKDPNFPAYREAKAAIEKSRL